MSQWARGTTAISIIPMLTFNPAGPEISKLDELTAARVGIRADHSAAPRRAAPEGPADMFAPR